MDYNKHLFDLKQKQKDAKKKQQELRDFKALAFGDIAAFIDLSNEKYEVQIGGSKGGGTVLTPYGKSLIASFETINRSCWEYLDEQLKKQNL